MSYTRASGEKINSDLFEKLEYLRCSFTTREYFGTTISGGIKLFKKQHLQILLQQYLP